MYFPLNVRRYLLEPGMRLKLLAPWCVIAALAACTNQNIDHTGQSTSDAAYKAALASGAVDVGNTICPVTGDKVGGSKLIEVYSGKIYHMCCSDCPADFKKDPAKYAKLVAENPAKYGVKKAG